MKYTYWEKEDFEKLETAPTYADLFLIAKDVLERMPQPVGQVCGPISTGGAGSVEKNLKRFDDTIADLQQQGMEIFNQVPFEIPIQRFNSLRGSNTYDDRLLNDFYLPIFESRLVQKLYFLSDWESSVGAKWEHEQALRLGLEIEYIA